jgi:hypothetical protein
MSVDAPPESTKLSLRIRLGLAGMVAVGAVGAVPCLVIVMIVTADSSWVTLVVFSVLALGPAIALWLTHGFRRRSFAVGLTAGWAAGALLIWWIPSGFSMSPEEIEQATAKILASGAPAYYLGENADVHTLSDLSEGPDGYFDFSYGPCRSSAGWGDDGGCSPALQVDTSPLTQAMMQAFSTEGTGPCRRLEPVLGVPAAVFYGELTLFTGSSQVVHAYYDAHRDLHRELALARTMRPLSHPGEVKTLPAPSAEILAFVNNKCGSVSG